MTTTFIRSRATALAVATLFTTAACSGGGSGSGETSTSAAAETTTSVAAGSSTSVDAPDNVDAALETISIVEINPGAGSGEAELILSAWPADLDHFRVSMDDGSGAGSVRLDILDEGTSPTPFLVVYPIPGGDMDFALSWEHVDGRDSAITYYTCTGYRLDTGC